MKSGWLGLGISLIVGMTASNVNGREMDRFDFGVNASYHLANGSYQWEDAVGVEARLTFWDLEFLNIDPDFGVALIAGYQLWNAADGSRFLDFSLSESEPFTVEDSVRGDAIMLPLGISGMYRGETYFDGIATFEAGVRYVFVDADVTYENEVVLLNRQTGLIDRSSSESRLDVDPGVTGLIALDVQFPVGERTDISVGIGWEFDVDAGMNSYDGDDGDNNKLDNYFIRAGFSW